MSFKKSREDAGIDRLIENPPSSAACLEQALLSTFGNPYQRVIDK